MLLECYSSGTRITEKESMLLEIELFTQIKNIKINKKQSCTEVAPDHICKATLVSRGSFWITCLAVLLDQVSPQPQGMKSRGERVFDELMENGYLDSV